MSRLFAVAPALVTMALLVAATPPRGEVDPTVARFSPSPIVSPSLSPTPTPTPTPRAVLIIRKTDLSGVNIPVAGVTFEVYEDSLQGRLVTSIATGNDGVAMTALLRPDHMYCIKETSAPAGFQLSPNYTPSDCAPGVPAVISVADPPVPTPTPTATPAPTPTPTPTPAPTGELMVTKTDPSGQVITVPGFTFDIHVGSATGQVIATISTDGSGTAIAGALNPATYCVEETAAPNGYDVAPTYSPSACVSVAADPAQGHNPTSVTVADATAPSPSPSASAAAAPPSSTPHAPTAVPQASSSSGLPLGLLSKLLIGFGVLMLGAGAVLVTLSVRRRRQRRMDEAEPPDVWYDSTIS